MDLFRNSNIQSSLLAISFCCVVLELQAASAHPQHPGSPRFSTDTRCAGTADTARAFKGLQWIYSGTVTFNLHFYRFVVLCWSCKRQALTLNIRDHRDSAPTQGVQAPPTLHIQGPFLPPVPPLPPVLPVCHQCHPCCLRHHDTPATNAAGATFPLEFVALIAGLAQAALAAQLALAVQVALAAKTVP